MSLNCIIRSVKTLAALCLLGSTSVMGVSLISEWMLVYTAPWIEELTMVFLGVGFVLGSVSAVLERAHVSISLFYERFSARTRLLIGIWGTLVCTLPWCGVILWAGLEKPTSFVRLSWSFLERSHQTGGLAGIFLFKTLVVLLALGLALTSAVLLWQDIKPAQSPTHQKGNGDG